MKSLKAKVLSDKMAKTAVVAVNNSRIHPLYRKILHKTSKFHADNTIGAKTGDSVEIVPTKKLSKTKFYKITKIIK